MVPYFFLLALTATYSLLYCSLRLDIRAFTNELDGVTPELETGLKTAIEKLDTALRQRRSPEICRAAAQATRDSLDEIIAALNETLNIDVYKVGLEADEEGVIEGEVKPTQETAMVAESEALSLPEPELSL